MRLNHFILVIVTICGVCLISGCDLIGALSQPTVHEKKVTAEYKIADRDENILVFVDRSAGVSNKVTRPDCWINIVPTDGLVLIQESSSGCTCGYSMQMSIAYLPVTN